MNSAQATMRPRGLSAQHLARPSGRGLPLRDRPLCYESIVFLCKVGVLLVDAEGQVVWPGDGTKLAVWHDWAARGAGATVDRARFAIYARVRRMLCVHELPHPDAILRALIKFAGGKPVTTTLARRLLGESETSKRNPAFRSTMTRRIAELQGVGIKQRLQKKLADPERLFDLFPPEARAPLRAHFQQKRIPAVRPPLSREVGRVMAIAAGPSRILAACLLLDACANRLALGTRKQIVSNGERCADVLPTGREREPDAVARAWTAYANREISPEASPLQRARTALHYGGAVTKAHSLAVLVLKENAHLITDLLPARQTDEALFRKLMKSRLKLIQGESRQTLEDNVVDIAARSLDVQIAVENRLFQLERILNAALDKLPEASALLSAGLRAGFYYEGL